MVLRPLPSHLGGQGQEEGEPFRGQSGRRQPPLLFLPLTLTPRWGPTQVPGDCAQVKASPALAWRPRAAPTGEVQENTELEG